MNVQSDVAARGASDAADLAIRARGLVKIFGDLRAVDGIDLDVPRGMIFAILGPNGAGKTTLMRMLATLSRPDGGSASVMGHDLVAAPREVRASIAMTGHPTAPGRPRRRIQPSRRPVSAFVPGRLHRRAPPSRQPSRRSSPPPACVSAPQARPDPSSSPLR